MLPFRDPNLWHTSSISGLGHRCQLPSVKTRLKMYALPKIRIRSHNRTFLGQVQGLGFRAIGQKV